MRMCSLATQVAQALLVVSYVQCCSNETVLLDSPARVCLACVSPEPSDTLPKGTLTFRHTTAEALQGANCTTSDDTHAAQPDRQLLRSSYTASPTPCTLTFPGLAVRPLRPSLARCLLRPPCLGLGPRPWVTRSICLPSGLRR